MSTQISANTRAPPHNGDPHINHRRGDITMPEQLLHGANVVAVLQQMRGE
jgi:hypothetical protein